VVRTEPHTGAVMKKQVELDDSKSKKGLGELYEEEYVKQREGPAAEQEETALHKEARALWAALSMRLDALSHFHFTPKPVVEEVCGTALTVQ
jgi:U3 small nucleolar RNA-associated protein MPP10